MAIQKNIDKILEEFKVLLDFSRDKAELENITINAQTIIDNLKEYWEESAPNAERLWMG